MSTTKVRYRICPPQRRSNVTYVAADSPLEAIQGCFPDHEITAYREGVGWTQYKVDPPIPWNWPKESGDKEEDNFGDVIDIEVAGSILVVGDSSEN